MKSPGGKIRKNFWRSYIQSIAAAFVLMASIVYPYLVMQFNPPPIEAIAESLRGEIISIQRQHPNILLKQADGTEQYLSFPGTLQSVYIAKYPNFTGVSREDLERLKGCDVEIKIDHIRGLGVPSSPRIWSIKCTKFSISYDKLSNYYMDACKFGASQWFLFGLGIFFLLLMIRTDSILRSRL